VNHGDRRKKIMTNITDQVVYDKCKERIQQEVNVVLKVINEEMNKEEKDIKKLSELFVSLSSLNQAVGLLNTIKPLEKEA
jgi:hypothetical protein